MTEDRTIQLHIVMDELGAFVVDADADAAAERAEQEFGEDAEVRQITLTLEVAPPSKSAGPVSAVCKID